MAVRDPATPESRRLALQLPRPLWIFLAAVVLTVAGLGLRFGVPFYRTRVAIREIEKDGGIVHRTQGDEATHRDPPLRNEKPDD